MAKFAYRVRDEEGKLLSGTMDGSSVDDCVARLEGKSLVPVFVEELNFDGTRKNMTFFEKLNAWVTEATSKVPYRAVVFFTRQLATLITSGVALPKAVAQLAKNEQTVFKKNLEIIVEDLGAGFTFSDSLAKHPGAFNHMFISVVRAGEAAGALDQVLEELADYMENMEQMKAKVKAAMRYPTIIAVFVSVVIIGVLMFLVPIFDEMYSSAGVQLPKPTQIMIAMSNAIRYNFLMVVLYTIAIALLFLIVYLATDKTKYLLDKFMFRLPIFGNVLRKNTLAVYCRTTALLMKSGTPILETTQIAGAAVSNKFYAEKLEGVYENLKRGELLSSSLVAAGTAEFPILVTQLVATGEESGKIDELLIKASEFYDREVKMVVDSLATIIEPILVVILGGVVGGMLIALYLPIFSMGQIMQ